MGIHFKQKKQQCVISNLNVRKERHGDSEKILGVDIKVQVNVPIGFLDQLSVEKDTKWGEFLYRESGDLKQLGIEPKLKLTREYNNHRAIISVNDEEMVFDEAYIKGISAEVMDGRRAAIEYTIQVHPSKEQVGILTDGLQEGVTIKVEPNGNQSDVEDGADKPGEDE